MPYNGSGVYGLPAGSTIPNGTLSDAPTQHNAPLNDIAAALNEITGGTQEFIGPVQLQNGTAAAPALTFASDTNTGIHRVGADSLGIDTNGATRVTINTTALTSTLPVNVPVGAAATPSLNFTSTDGFWSPGAGIVALSLGGVEQLRWTTTGARGAIAPVPGSDSYRVINGDFRVNQSGVTSGAALAAASYPVSSVTGGRGPDGFYAIKYTTDTVTFGTPAGYRPNSVGYSLACTGPFNGSSTFAAFVFRIENAAIYSGQTITLFARMNGATAHDVSVSYRQHFGTGGSPSADVSGNVSKVAITTGWNPYKFTFTVPSVSGKTFGSNNNDYLEFAFWIAAGSNYTALTSGLGSGNRTVFFSDIHERLGDWPIETIDYYQSPDPQTELARCQRYFTVLDTPMKISAAAPQIGQTALPVTMRATPTLSNITFSSGTGATFSASKTSIIQTNLHSTAANVSSITASAEL